MKNLMKGLVLALAIGSTLQAIQVYAQERVTVSIEEEERTLSRLIQLKRNSDLSGKTLDVYGNETDLLAEFPNIKTEDDFKEAFATHALRYLQSIGGEEAFKKVLQQKVFARFHGSEPGI